MHLQREISHGLQPVRHHVSIHLSMSEKKKKRINLAHVACVVARAEAG
jgi:hypothetical protein